MTLPPPRSTLFPYTTLFRSTLTPSAGRLSVANSTLPEIDPRTPSAAVIRVRITNTQISSVASHVNVRSEEHTSELQSRQYLVCRLLLEKKKKNNKQKTRSSN